MITKQADESLVGLVGSRHGEVETKLRDDLSLQVDEFGLRDGLLLLGGEQTDHPVEAGTYRLLEFSRHKNRDGR